MKITDISVGRVRIPLKNPFKTALRVVYALEDVVVQVTTDAGIVAFGEAPPTAAITGETLASIEAAVLAHIRPAIVGMDMTELDEIMLRMHGSIVGNTSAKAAVDMALYDLFARQCGLPLYQLLGGAKREMETDITISLNAGEQMVADSLRAVAAGYRILKIKVGKHGLEDALRIAEIRSAVGKDVRLRVDANQGWDAKQSVRIIRAMEDKGLDIELVEQPVRADDLAGMAYVTQRVGTPILADESVFSAKDAVTIIQTGAADYLNIKLMKTGGIYKALEVCAVAQAHGVPCMIGCMLESKLAVSAAAHLAGGRGVITMMDLDGPSLCGQDPFTGGPAFDGPRICLTDAPGTGITGIVALGQAAGGKRGTDE